MDSVAESYYNLKSIKRSRDRLIIKFAIDYICKAYNINLLGVRARGSSAIMRELRSLVIFTVQVEHTSNRLRCHYWYPERSFKTIKIPLHQLYDATNEVLAGAMEVVNSTLNINAQCNSLEALAISSAFHICGCIILPSIPVRKTEIDEPCNLEKENESKKRQGEEKVASMNELGMKCADVKKTPIQVAKMPLSSQLQRSYTIYLPPIYPSDGLVEYSERSEKSEGHGINKIGSLSKLTINPYFNSEIATESLREVYKNDNVIKKSQRETALPSTENSLSRQQSYSSIFSVLSQVPSTEMSLSRRSSCSSGWFADSEESEENEDHRIKSCLRKKATINVYMTTFPYRVVGPGPGKRLLHEIPVSGKLEIKLQQSGYSPSDESGTDTAQRIMQKKKWTSRSTKQSVIESQSDY